METNPNITRLLEMLDNTQAYSEQEIRDIINSDEETREAYRLMVAAKQGYIYKQIERLRVGEHSSGMHPADMQAVWQQFEAKHYPQQSNRGWMKIAASFIGVLFVSGMAFAAIHIWNLTPNPSAKGEEKSYTQASDTIRQSSSLPLEGSGEATPVIYDNIPLEKVLSEIADHYGVEVTFQNEETRELRFHFVWNPLQGIDRVVNDLNHFERLHVTLKDNQLIVE